MLVGSGLETRDDFVGGFAVQPRSRLVYDQLIIQLSRANTKENNLGEGNKLTCCRNTSLLSSADTPLQGSPNLRILDSQQSELPQQIHRPFFSLTAIHGRQSELGGKLDRFANRQGANQMILLFDVSANGSERSTIKCRPVEEPRACHGTRLEASGEDVQEGRLSTPTRSHQRQQFP